MRQREALPVGISLRWPLRSTLSLPLPPPSAAVCVRRLCKDYGLFGGGIKKRGPGRSLFDYASAVWLMLTYKNVPHPHGQT